MNRKILIGSVLILPFIVADVALFTSQKVPFVQVFVPFLGVFAIFFGIIVIAKRRDGQKIEADERSVRIAQKSMSYSWIAGVYLIFLLITNEQLGLVKLSGTQELFLTLAVLLFSNLIFRAVLNRRPDVS